MFSWANLVNSIVQIAVNQRIAQKLKSVIGIDFGIYFGPSWFVLEVVLPVVWLVVRILLAYQSLRAFWTIFEYNFTFLGIWQFWGGILSNLKFFFIITFW